MYDQWEVELPELTGDEVRNAYIYVPDEAEEDPDLRFPVLYMFDGQNLFFDEDATYGKSWGIREYLEENISRSSWRQWNAAIMMKRIPAAADCPSIRRLIFSSGGDR